MIGTGARGASGPRRPGARGTTSAVTTLVAVGPVWFISTGSAWCQTLGQAPETDVSWVRVIAALVLCLGLAVGGAYVMRTRLRGRTTASASQGRQLELLETIRLSHQADICLLRFGEARLLVAATAQGVTLLARDPPGATAAGEVTAG